MLLGDLVIGNCVNSAAYAFNRSCYFLTTSEHIPAFYENMPFKILGSKRQDYTWSRLIMSMSLQGKLLSFGEVQSTKVTEEKITIVHNGTKNTYLFDRCYVFDTTDLVLENEIVKSAKDSYKVQDDFEISNLGSKHKYLEPKISKDKLASQIHYYTSDRVDGANYVTDCVVESNLSKKQLNDFDYSDSMVRFCVERHLNSIGVFGSFMNFYKNGNPKYRKPKVIHKTRLVIKKENNRYLDSEKIKFRSDKIEDIFR